MMAKRAFDVLVASVLLVLTGPLLLMLICMVRLRLGRPALFRQIRPGRSGQPFTLYKLRTMRDALDRAGKPLLDELRLTPLGRSLRALSLDELPQLINVLRGEMSLVGPRPLLLEYLPLYSTRQARRHELRPGITGWAQVNGRNALDWQARLELDVWYVEHRSMRLDLVILWLTVGRVLTRRDIAAPGQATMSKFTGNPRDPA